MNLDDLRKKIDEVDNALLIALAQRKDIVKQIGEIKRISKRSAKDDARWQEVLQSRKVMAQKLGIPVSVMTSIWEILHEWALKIEHTS